MNGAATAPGRSWRVSFRTGGRRRCCYWRSHGWLIQDSPTTIGTASPRNGEAPSRRHLRAINAHHLHTHRFYMHDIVPGFAQGGICRADQGPERRAAGTPRRPTACLRARGRGGSGMRRSISQEHQPRHGVASPPTTLSDIGVVAGQRRRQKKPSHHFDYIVQLSLHWHRLSRPRRKARAIS